MAGLFDKQAAVYADSRPTYPSEWFSMLAALTPHHSLAWDVGTGNGQAAIEVSKHYDQVIATDVSDEQLKYAKEDPKVRYLHTPLSISDEEILSLFGGENSVDLVTVATAVHWFDLEKFYSIVKRVLRKPGGIIAVWTYGIIQVSPEFDPLMNRFFERTVPFRNPEVEFAFQCYKTLPFPFQEVGLGREGQPKELEMPKVMTFQGFLGLMRSASGVQKAKEKGVELLTEEVIKEFESAWGGSDLVRSVVYKTYMLAGKP